MKINNFSFPSPRLLKWRLYILFDEFENISKSEKEKSELVIMLKNNTKKIIIISNKSYALHSGKGH